MTKIGLIDYGMGNLFSVQQAFKRVDQPLNIISDIKTLRLCDALVLPGVGSFDPAMTNLRNTDLVPSIIDWVNDGKPLFGICLGLQLLFESSDEGTSKGLGVIKGQIHKLPKEENERIPHIGWSQITKTNECPILENYPKSDWVYFVHSYSACPLEAKSTVATTKYGETDFSSIVWHKNTGACQFHPEKSGLAGQKLIYNWLNWLKKTNF